MRVVPPWRSRHALRTSDRSFFFLFLILAATLALAMEPPKEKKPLPSGLEEKVERRLVQLDVTVEGKSVEIHELTAADFEVFVAGREIADLAVDRLCPSPETEGERAAVGPEGSQPPLPAGAPPATAPATFVFFFDQPHLTLAGRQRGLEVARDLVSRLIRGSDRAMIISTARDMKTVTPLTKNREDLLRGLHRLENDLTQLDTYAEEESSRILSLAGAMDGSSWTERARARTYQREEWWQARKSLDRLGIVLGAFLDVPPPKVVFYFADTLRQQAGLHYCHLVGGCDQGDDLMPEAAFDFDRAIAAASKTGVHIYPIQAEGLAAPYAGLLGGLRSLPRNPKATLVLGYERTRHAEDSMVGLALETGGEAFLRGITPARIARRIHERLGCLYLVSFDPKDLATDKPLPITVRVKRPGLKTRVQGRLVLQSESERATSRLLAAFAAPTARESDFRVGVEIIPIGFEKKRYRTLVQVKVPGTGSAGAEMDLGASLLGSGRVREDFSARLKVGAPGLTFVLEKEVEIEPGPFEIAAAGHDVGKDEIGTGRAEGAWPDPRDAEASASPIALLQEATAAFSRDGAVRTSGALALSEGESVRADRSAALVAVVCRNGQRRHPLRVERTLAGETHLDFDPLELGAAQEPCIQIRDVIPANTLGPGGFRYDLRVKALDRMLIETTREFVVGAGAPRG